MLSSYITNTRLAAQPFITELQASPSETVIHSAIHANTKVTNARAIAKALEETNSIMVCWMLNSAEWQEAIVLHQGREYHRLLDELEFHAVLRQFEIEKLGLPKTGMSYVPMCVHSLSS